MSVNKYVYVGVYFKVYLPKEKYYIGIGKCPKCHDNVFGEFCPRDGEKTSRIELERMIDFYEFCGSVFGDEGKFQNGNISYEDFEIFMANRDNQPGHVCVGAETEQMLPAEDYSGDWQLLADALDERSIKYEKHFGIVSYWM